MRNIYGKSKNYAESQYFLIILYVAIFTLENFINFISQKVSQIVLSLIFS